ncbi:nuclear transport factor 2 family protein [Streptomyces sp. ISL-44]|uniref:nuclear transport factor 2 family protein n=1 Tax=unclassified Streptomyces TaxID=2593676 RepID=UPI001BE4E7FE|nr:nuclear transport factor 2 family protein [Streptomyces sp. ISL-44]MBT2542099.1 nuclear transport factor 2 family protein [Streptomyces sp. ISL-44]
MTIQAGIGQQAAVAFGALYAEVQQFYAHQMQLLDLGESQRWAETFTEDATFDVPTLPEPVRGRAGLVAATSRTAAQLAEAGQRHRHFIGMFDVSERPDGVVDVRSYAIVYASAIGGDSQVHRVCVCEDVLVRVEGALQVATRRVTRDDLA